MLSKTCDAARIAKMKMKNMTIVNKNITITKVQFKTPNKAAAY